MKKTILSLVALSMLLLGGCVPQANYVALESETKELQVAIEVLKEERDTLKSELAAITPAPKMVKAYIEGETAVKVVSIMPLYPERDEPDMPYYLVVQRFQGGYEMMGVRAELGKQLKVGELYCFKVADDTICDISEDDLARWEYAPLYSYDDIPYNFVSFRPINIDTEWGLSSLQPKFRRVE